MTDVRRGQIFTKLARAITVAAREGGADPAVNVRLRMAMDRALTENMPKENIQRAIDRATGADAASTMEALTLEGFGPGGSALLMDLVTDNRNRSVSEIRRLLAAAGGSLGETGTTQWMFERRGRIVLEDVRDPDAAELAAIDAGAVDSSREETTLTFITPPELLRAVTDALTSAGYKSAAAELLFLPRAPLQLSVDHAVSTRTLVENLEERDDVTEVATNAIPPTA